MKLITRIYLFEFILTYLLFYIVSIKVENNNNSLNSIKNRMTKAFLRQKTILMKDRKILSDVKFKQISLMLEQENSYRVNQFDTPGASSLFEFLNPKKPHKVQKLREYSLKQANTNHSEQDVILENWLMISSRQFTNKSKFPPIVLPDGKTAYIKYDANFFRLNPAKECLQVEGIPTSEKLFWFRLSTKHIYYASSQTDVNVLGSFELIDIEDISKEEDYSSDLAYCMTLHSKRSEAWKLCSSNSQVINEWYCKLKTLLNQTDPLCIHSNTKVIEKRIIQPIVIIPLPSKHCNQDWNYQQNGDDWECECSEGHEQSPIDLPSKSESIDSPIRPVMSYHKVSSLSPIDTIDKELSKGTSIKLEYRQNKISILHQNLGKLVTMDGAVYRAEEITFHTPSNHKINNEEFDLEMTIIHYGISKGDIAKQATLNFLFKRSPGTYNKFFDDLDFFNLPSPLTKEIPLEHGLFIPKVFYSSDDEESSIEVMKDFSFYTYQGSLPFPPCTERTVVYVVSEPIPLSTTTIHLFKEALRKPDLMTNRGDVIVSDSLSISNRKIQSRNGRPVFHFDHTKHCIEIPRHKKPLKVGHYEKVSTKSTQYFYVNGEKPSGLPGSFVVSEREAKGIKSIE